jgi:hypothetical protein
MKTAVAAAAQAGAGGHAWWVRHEDEATGMHGTSRCAFGARGARGVRGLQWRVSMTA